MDYTPIASDENEPSNSLGNKTLLTLVILASIIGSFLFGYDTGIIGVANIYIEKEWGLSVFIVAIVVAITVLGAFIGSLIASPISDKWGRKVPLYIADVLFIIGSITMALAPNVWVLILGRFIIGICVGIYMMLVPAYLSEMVPSSIRGGVVAMAIVFVTGGQFISYAVGLALAPNWRLMLGIGAVPAVLQLILLVYLPESPRYLVFSGKTDEAMEVLSLLRTGRNEVENEEKIQ